MWYKLKKIYIYPDGVTEKQVYPAWWRPNANTLLYLPLATNSNDQSWNGNNGTDTNITYSWNKAVFNSSWTSCILIDKTTLPTTFTLHLIAQITTLSWYQLAFRYSDNVWQDICRCYLNWYGSIQVWMWVNTTTTGIASDTNEHLYSWVVQSNSMKFYIDGVLKYTYNQNVGSYANPKISFWNRWYNMNEWLKWTMREVIMESSYRTDAEVLALAQQYGFAS